MKNEASTTPLPASGGSYIREADGRLTRIEDAPVPAPAADTDPAEKPDTAPASPVIPDAPPAPASKKKG